MSDSLENLAQSTPVHRYVYGNDPDNKPNDHCVWQNTGIIHEIWEWVETDDHFRERIKSIHREPKQ